MMMTRLLLITACCIIPLPVMADSNKHEHLQYNPFSQPAKQEVVKVQKKEVSRKQEKPPEIELRAVIVSQEMPMANLGGNILKIGEEYEGFRLISVSEGQAEFTWNGQRQIKTVGETRAGQRK